MDKVTAKIEYLQRELDALKKLLADKNVGSMVELIQACVALDAGYQQWCETLDDEGDLSEGTTYGNDFGHCMSYETDVEIVHSISLALRKIMNAMHPEKTDEEN